MDSQFGLITFSLLLSISCLCSAIEPTSLTLDLATTIPVSEPSCEHYRDQNLTAYIGWPLVISCKDLAHEIFSKIFLNINSMKNSTVTCMVQTIPTGIILSNQSMPFDPLMYPSEIRHIAHQLDDITDDALKSYRVVHKVGNYCLYRTVHLRLEKNPEPDCKNPPRKHSFTAGFGKYQVLTCEGKNLPELDSILPATGIEYKWYLNCGDKPESRFPKKGNKLEMIESELSYAGSYFCVVEYKGQEIPVIEFDVCVEYDTSIHDSIEMSCDTKKVLLGEDATISCSTAVSTSKANVLHVSSAWYKEGNATSICQRQHRYAANETGYQCSMKSSIKTKTCYTADMSPEKFIDIYTVNLTIEEVTSSELGVYQLEFVWGLNKVIRVNVTLEEDIGALLDAQIAGISVATFNVVLLIIFLLFCLWKKQDVAWFLKKHFGRYETESYTYIAYFAYYYDLDHASSESMKLTKTLVEHLHDFMDRFGGTVYDEQRDPNVVSGDADNIKSILGDSHRIILILSPDYVKDQWSRYKTNTTLVETIETGKKVIFITIPESNTAIEELEEAPRKTLLAAMKRNVTISWNGKVPFKGSIKRRLEYGLPKLQKPEYSRYLSDSSQAQLTYQNSHTKYGCSSSSGSNNVSEANGFDAAV